MWIRSSQVFRASGCIVYAKVATVLGAIPASSDTVESEGRQMKQCWITYIKRKTEKFPLKKWFVCISFRFDFFASFCLFPFVFALDFFLVKQFFGSFSFHFDFSPRFAYFTFVFASDFCCFASMWIKCLFFASKRNEIFASISIFASEAKTRAHPTVELI